MQVQEELVRRRVVHTSPNGKTRTFSSNHVFAQIIICGKCGEVFRRVHWNNRGKKSIVWRCVSRLENTGQFCDARTVLESTIEQVLVSAINQALCDKDTFLSTLRDNIATVINRENDQTLADIDKRLEELQMELLKLASSNADYEKVGDEIYRLRDQKQELQVENANRDELKKRMADMSTFLKKQTAALTEYDEQLVRRLIEKVTIYADKFTVEFKSGFVNIYLFQKSFIKTFKNPLEYFRNLIYTYPEVISLNSFKHFIIYVFSPRTVPLSYPAANLFVLLRNCTHYQTSLIRILYIPRYL
jgi:site-specific DNA recombinase